MDSAICNEYILRIVNNDEVIKSGLTKSWIIISATHWLLRGINYYPVSENVVATSRYSGCKYHISAYQVYNCLYSYRDIFEPTQEFFLTRKSYNNNKDKQ